MTLSGLSKALILPVVALVVAGCGAAVPNGTASSSQGTAGDLYSDVLAYAQTQHPEAVLVGYNNHAPTFDRMNAVPTERDTSGDINYWSYIFAESDAAFTDGEISDSEVFGVEFFNGDLIYAGYAQTRDRSVDANTVLGEDMLAYDTDVVLEKFLAAVKAETGEDLAIHHLGFNVSAGGYEITAFTSDMEGYDAKFNVETGEIGLIQAFEISVL